MIVRAFRGSNTGVSLLGVGETAPKVGGMDSCVGAPLLSLSRVSPRVSVENDFFGVLRGGDRVAASRVDARRGIEEAVGRGGMTTACPLPFLVFSREGGRRESR